MLFLKQCYITPSSSLRIFGFVVHLKLFKNKVESDAHIEMQELFLKQCYITSSSSLRIFGFVVHLKLFKNKVESDAHVEMQELFVTTNIRVLYVHWNECVRKKVNS